MKSTGIIRKVDILGRVVLPIELRRNLKIDVKDPLEIFIEGENIVLKKYVSEMECIITGEISSSNCKLANGKIVVSPKGARELLEELNSFLQSTYVG